MINEHHQEQAALYVLGAMEPSVRSAYEQEIAHNPDLQNQVDAFQAIVAEMSMALSGQKMPSPELKSRIMAKIAEGEIKSTSSETEESSFGHLAKEKEGIVVTDKDGLVEWINQVQSEMCGYTLEEVRGKKLGPLLQALHLLRLAGTVTR